MHRYSFFYLIDILFWNILRTKNSAERHTCLPPAFLSVTFLHQHQLCLKMKILPPGTKKKDAIQGLGTLHTKVQSYLARLRPWTQHPALNKLTLYITFLLSL